MEAASLGISSSVCVTLVNRMCTFVICGFYCMQHIIFHKVFQDNLAALACSLMSLVCAPVTFHTLRHAADYRAQNVQLL